VILLSVLMAGAALVGLMALRAVQPLVTEHDDRIDVIGQRTRAALERDKLLALRAIKELEFDRAMGRLSDDDFKEMAGRLRTRATRADWRTMTPCPVLDSRAVHPADRTIP